MGYIFEEKKKKIVIHHPDEKECFPLISKKKGLLYKRGETAGKGLMEKRALEDYLIAPAKESRGTEFRGTSKKGGERALQGHSLSREKK